MTYATVHDFKSGIISIYAVAVAKHQFWWFSSVQRVLLMYEAVPTERFAGQLNSQRVCMWCWSADAMKGLGDELSGQDCSHLLEAMDIHGSITEEDFLAIVEVGRCIWAMHAVPSRLFWQYGHHGMQF